MQVKKFEAPTIQEALDTIKRELGPDAIILQTKKYKRGFGLMSRASVEVTAAISERSLQKKQYVEKRLPESTRDSVRKLPAEKQAEFFDKSTRGRSASPSAAAAQARTAGPVRTEATAPPRAVAGAYTASARSAPKMSEVSGRHGGAPVDQLLGGADAYVATPARVPSTVRPAFPERLEERPGTKAAAHAAVPDTIPKVTSRRYVEIPEGDDTGSRPLMTIDEEVRHLKRMIEELKSAQDSAQEFNEPVGAQASRASSLANASSRASSLANASMMKAGEAGLLGTPALQGAFEQLVINGIDKKHAFSLIRTVAFELGPERSANPDEVIDSLAGELMKTTRVAAPFASLSRKTGSSDADLERRRGPLVIALVGPTGVGKTTTVAKLASDAILKRNLRVGLINLDSYKIAAFDQLGTYAKILNVPFRSVATADDLRAAVQDFQPLDLVLIDTTGRSQRDPASLKEMQEVLTVVPGAESQLVLSVTTRDAELYDMTNRFTLFRPSGIIMSKLDEATVYGSMYNVSLRAQLPLLAFTTGQRVPEDIEDATRERVAALLLDL